MRRSADKLKARRDDLSLNLLYVLLLDIREEFKGSLFSHEALIKFIGHDNAINVEQKERLLRILIQKYIGTEFDSRILLALFGLSDDYKNTVGIEKRRRQLGLDYMKERYPKKYREYSECDDDERREKILGKAVGSLAKDDLYLTLLLAVSIYDETNDVFIKNCIQRVNEGNGGSVPVVNTPDKRGFFARYIDGERQLAIRRFSYDYRAGTIPFCFREKELNQLDDFCKDGRLVSWWAVVGGGGAGKSRLAHQFMLTRSSPEWKIVFLRDEFFAQINGGGKYQTYTEWSHHQNLLLVVDYVQRYSKAVAQWIENVTIRKADGKKIRILLLERDGESGLWNMDFAVRENLYPSKYEPFLELTSLSDEELKGFAHDYIGEREVAEKETKIARAIETLPEIDKEKRILYFIMLLDRFIEDTSAQVTTSKEDLFDYILKREIRTLQSRFPGFHKNPTGFKSYMQLLIYATATGEISLDNLPEWLLGKYEKILDEFPNKTAALVAMGAPDKILRPLTPNLIGEYFVLSSVEEYFGTDVEWFIKYSWDSPPNNFMNFLVKIALDFGADGKLNESAWFKKVLNGPLVENEEAFYSYFAMLPLVLFFHRRFPMSWDECWLKMQEVCRHFHQDEYIINYLEYLWDNCQGYLPNAKFGLWMLDRIDFIIESKLDRPDVIFACAKILEDISAWQLEKSKASAKTPYDDVSEPHELSQSEKEDFIILVRATNIFMKILKLEPYKSDVVIATMFAMVLPQSIVALSSDEYDGAISLLDELAVRHAKTQIWLYYLFVLLQLFQIDNTKKDIIIEKIRAIAEQNSDIGILASVCNQYINDITEGKIIV